MVLRQRKAGARSNALGVYVCFMAVCCSTLMLQVLTSTTPSALFSRETFLQNSLVDLLTRFTTPSTTATSPATGKAAAMSTVDLRIANVSVHRVRYVETETNFDDDDGAAGAGSEEDAGASSFLAMLRAKAGDLLRVSKRNSGNRAEVSGVVVTWDDHFKGENSEEEEDMEREQERASSRDKPPSQRRASVVPGVVITYEVQHWVTTWGLDALWHASNRKFAVADPFVVLSQLPVDHDIAFRVRMKVKKTTGLLSGLFATETEGPWSDIVLLSPSRDDALDAIFAFLSSNKAFCVVLAVCIGSGSLVVFKLLVGRRLLAMRDKASAALTIRTDISNGGSSSRSPHQPSRSSSSGGDLEQEVRDLRQELADSEAEVRKLMLYRGYGLEELSPDELTLVEKELRATLTRVQKVLREPLRNRQDAQDNEPRSSKRDRLRAVFEDEAY
uniref:K-box domain-containing protein n=1 Tax=Globisporangium ultimum (strain ATCC 200006 / CBS 805.95 / DAOM BR144) TaxID=431595 RepID=K3WIN7_GLOUD